MIPEEQLTCRGEAHPFHEVYSADKNRLWTFLILGEVPKTAIFSCSRKEDDGPVSRIVSKILGFPFLRGSIDRELLLERKNRHCPIGGYIVRQQVVPLKDQNISGIRPAESGNLTLMDLFG